MNLFKKIIATIALSALVVATATPSVSAYSTASLDAANTLASQGIINDHSGNASAYNLDQNVLRQEIAAVTMGVAGLTKKTTCDNEFADVSATNPNTWACYVVETLRDNAMIAANANFNPEANITKTEALGMVVKAAFGDGYSFDASLSTTWQEQLVAFAAENGVVEAFADYNTPATRGWVFEAATASMDAASLASEDDDLLLSELLDGFDDIDDDTTDDDTTDDDGVTVVPGSDLLVELSPETPNSATLPGSVNGIPVASFDFTAGSEDVTVTQVTVKRRGLSDNDTLQSLAVYTEEGRASNEKNDNQENDTEAQLNLFDGGVVVKAGETRTLTIVADLGTASQAANDEFAIELVDVVANANVEGLSNLVANTMRIGSIDAPEIVVTPGSTVSNPTLGEQGADIFEFEIDGASDEDVVLKSITFEGSNDASDDLMNFELVLNNEVVAETASMNGDFLTFDLGEGLTLREDKNEDFIVRADVVEGAGDTIQFKIDKALDVTAESTKFGFGASVDIDAVDANGDLGTVTLEAGELTIFEIEADSDEIREDKNNVVLGGFKLTNVAGQSLELQEFGVRIVATVGTTGLTKVSEFFTDVELFNEETGSSYELTLDGTDDADAVFSEDSIDVVIPQGDTTWSIRVDTAETINNFDTASFALSFTTGQISATTGGFYAVETEDDTEVKDITPSSISFNTIDGTEAGATASLTPLADVTVVRGAKDLVALQFQIEAEKASAVTVDEVVATVATTPVAAVAEVHTVTLAGTEDDATAETIVTTITDAGGTTTFTTEVPASTAATAAGTNISVAPATATGTPTQTYTVVEAAGVITITGDTTNVPFTVANAASSGDDITVASSVETTPASAAVVAFSSTNLPNQSISEAKLYKGSVSASNLLDQESGSNIGNDGTITFNDFNEVSIAANGKQTFVVTLSFVDGQDVVDNSPFSTTLTSVSVEDDDNDDVTVTAGLTSTRDITVEGFGVLTITEDNNNEDNKDNKTILAGGSATVFSVDVQSINEAMDVETVVFTVAGATALGSKITNASLYLDNQLIDTNSNSDITATTITFDNLTNLTVEEMTSELKLVFNTETIGYQKVGATDLGITITNVSLEDTQGADSGKDAADVSLAVTSQTIDIVPAILTPSVTASLNSSATPQIRLTSDVDGNTVDTSNSSANVLVDTITLSTLGTSAAGPLTYTLTNVDDSSDSIVGVPGAGNTLVFTLAGMTDTNQTVSSSVSETFKITITGTAEGDTVSLLLLENGVSYTVVGNAGATGLTTNMTNELDLGSRSY